MTRCKQTPYIERVDIVAAQGRSKVHIPVKTVEFVLQVRSAVGITISLDSTAGGSVYFSLAAGGSYTEERLVLTGDLDLWVGAAADCTVEVWRWEG